MAYRPGQGLCKESLERLKKRREEGTGGRASEFPAEDDSEQANLLLGNGAMKKPRCGVCTRMLKDEELDIKRVVCFRCQPEPAQDRRRDAAGGGRKRSRSRSARPPPRGGGDFGRNGRSRSPRDRRDRRERSRSRGRGRK
eukprot:gnl/TRDRNA2_/TRDRNA2_64235_c0_seq2.p3 gnl/TRDRNA2_/TRDRNA2_64235_c0~~gnl/TRDRNA2_/TRDRNA2_64235_c0_seq2.p3  ORF type:complete len:140 (+),score=17.69 gnl/TRDRNA2_/TRDRNA2_64235_c0_seq2:158-577(+)